MSLFITSNMLRIFILSCVLNIFFVSAEVDQSGWIDPYDMTPEYISENDPYEENIQTETTNLRSNIFEIKMKPENPCEEQSLQDLQFKAYLKRTINLILNAVHEDAFEEDYYKGHLIINIDSQKYNLLKDFTEDRFNDLSAVDSVLSEILSRPSYDYLKEYFKSSFHKMFTVLMSRKSIICICSLTYLFVVYKMMAGHFKFWYIIKFLFINLIIFDFVFMWIRLYQNAEAEKISNSMKYKDIPVHCNPQKLSTTEMLWNILSSRDECKEYHQITLTDVFWNVSPGDVLTDMFTRTITRPMEAIGPAVGSFVYGIMGQLPWGVNIIVLPLILFFVMVMTCIFLSFILNVPIKFNFFHLMSFSFGDSGRRNNSENVLTGRSVEQLLHIVKENSVPRILEDRNERVRNEPIQNLTQEMDTKQKKHIDENIKEKLVDKKQIGEKLNGNKLKAIENGSVSEEDDSEVVSVVENKENLNVNESIFEENNDNIRKRKRDGAGDS